MTKRHRTHHDQRTKTRQPGPSLVWRAQTSKIRTVCATPLPQVTTIPGVRPEADKNKTAWIATFVAGLHLVDRKGVRHTVTIRSRDKNCVKYNATRIHLDAQTIHLSAAPESNKLQTVHMTETSIFDSSLIQNTHARISTSPKNEKWLCCAQKKQMISHLSWHTQTCVTRSGRVGLSRR